MQYISSEPQYFCVTVKIFLHTKFPSTQLILYRTHQSLSGSQKIFSGFTFSNNEYSCTLEWMKLKELWVEAEILQWTFDRLQTCCFSSVICAWAICLRIKDTLCSLFWLFVLYNICLSYFAYLNYLKVLQLCCLINLLEGLQGSQFAIFQGDTFTPFLMFLVVF